MKFFGIFFLVILSFGCTLSVSVHRATQSSIIPTENEEQSSGVNIGEHVYVVNNVTHDKADTVTPDKTATVKTDIAEKSTVTEQQIQQNDNRTVPAKNKKKINTTLYFESDTKVLKVERSEHDSLISCQVLDNR